MTSNFIVEHSGKVATVTFNRPDRLNAMTDEGWAELAAILDRLAGLDDTTVVVLTGAGRGFCAGGDLVATAGEESVVKTFDATVRDLRSWSSAADRLRSMNKVTIAAVNGAAAGAGLSLACAADIRVASESAVFRTAFLSAGLSGDFGGAWNLSRIVGEARAREMYLLNEKVSAPAAAEIGLVSKVYNPEVFVDSVRALAQELSGRAPLALRAIKENFVDAARLGLAEYMDREIARHVALSRTADASEAAAAFTEKRDAIFVGK